MESEGVKAACKSVHDVLGGVPINYYAVVDYDGVAKIVDSIGGVPVDIPFNMYYTDRKQGLYIDLKAGDDQTLDGEHAVQFLRYRKGYGNGDIGRVDAQQQFIKAAIKKSLGLNLPNVARTVVENVDSDIDIRAMLYLVSHVSGMGSDDLKSHMLPGVPETTNVGSFWIAADDYEVTKMMKEVYTGEVMTTGGAISSSAISSSAVSPSAAGAPEE
jgi:LCP family protein required for cell wall assembly